MTAPVRNLRLHIAFFALAALLAALAPLRVHAQVVVIANSSVTTAEISSAELRDIFTGAASSLKGSGQVAPVLLKGGPAHDDFLTAYIGKSDAAFRAGWRSLLFSGQSAMPKTFDSDADVVEYVARTRGAVGYISRSSPHTGVKTLAVR